jgi:two-component system, NarL family, nitrate/nitrite response regulator NarL
MRPSGPSKIMPKAVAETGTVRDSRLRCAGETRDRLPHPASIVLIDDDWAPLARLREIIEQNSDLVVVAACRCATGAMLAVERYRPAVLILDVRLPDRDGAELIRDITARSETKVIVFTAPLQKTEVIDLLQSGAEAIVFKDQPASTLVSCVREALAAKPCSLQSPRAGACDDVKYLSPREQEVAQWAAAGARNKEIAWRLGISEGTVKLHLFHAYRKLRVGNRVGLARALGSSPAKDINDISVYNFRPITFV